MAKYFGTDGIRGVANEGLTIELALKVGKYLGYRFHGGKLLIGQDTRISSPMLAHAIAAGASSSGADVFLLGICATPALAHVIVNQGFDTGVMISASHNPYHDNGLKCFSKTGMKIDDELEQEIEDYIDGKIDIEAALVAGVGRIYDYHSGLEVYLQYLEDLIHADFSNLKIVLDLANGSAVSSAERVFKALGADIVVLNDTPDGININKNCGSTHIENLREAVVAAHADMGFAFDGDADRCLAVDHQGNIVDGDQILYILGQRYLKEKSLKDHTIVATVMANLGFMRACEESGIHVICTQVGDKYVFAEMMAHDYVLGGEQSGHIIIKEHATTGDGVLTALILAETVAMTKKSLQKLGAACVRFPQILKNVVVKDKDKIMNDEGLQAAIKHASDALGMDGRVLVRPSGTEPLVRVMVEAKTLDLCQSHVDDMIEAIENIQ